MSLYNSEIEASESLLMPTSDTIILFMATSVLIITMPGPSNLYVMSRSLRQGYKAGCISSLGLGTGALVHALAAATGLSTVFNYNPIAYTLVKYLGALYLVYLGINALLAQSTVQVPTPISANRTLARVYAQGIVTELLNPKTTLFFLSFLPQFVDPAQGTPALQMLVLGFLFVLIGLPIDLLVALSSGTIARHLARRLWLRRIQKWFSGSVLIGLGIHVAVSERK